MVNVIELISYGAAKNIGEPGIGAEADDGSNAHVFPLSVLRLLLDGVNAHAAVINISAFGGKTSFENGHLKARKRGNAVDAEITALQQGNKRSAVRNVKGARLETAIGQRFLQGFEAFEIGVGGDYLRDA